MAKFVRRNMFRYPKMVRFTKNQLLIEISREHPYGAKSRILYTNILYRAYIVA